MNPRKAFQRRSLWWLARGEEQTSPGAVRASKNKYKNNQFYGPAGSAHAWLFSAFKGKRKEFFRGEKRCVWKQSKSMFCSEQILTGFLLSSCGGYLQGQELCISICRKEPSGWANRDNFPRVLYNQEWLQCSWQRQMGQSGCWERSGNCDKGLFC